jgi:hypothetical protein
MTTSLLRHPLILLFCLAISLPRCSSSGGGAGEGGGQDAIDEADGAADVGGDASSDTTGDVATDADPDAEPDAEPDVGPVDATERPPLAQKITTFLRAEEFAVFLPGVDPEALAIIQDDQGEPDPEGGGDWAEPGALGQIADPLGTETTFGRLIASESADLDADGRDELVILSIYTDGDPVHINGYYYVYDHLRITILDDLEAGQAPLSVIERGDLDLSMIDADKESFIDADLAVANLDDDDALELVVSGTYGETTQTSSGAPQRQARHTVLWCLDDPGAGFASLTTITGQGADLLAASIDTGDIDGDGRDELVLTGWDIGGDSPFVKAWLLDDHLAGYEQLKRWHDQDDMVFDYRAHKSSVALADYDADGLDEVAFVVVDYHGDVRLHIYDDLAAELKRIKAHDFRLDGGASWDSLERRPQLRAADLDGDGRPDLAVAFRDMYAEDRGWHVFAYFPARGDEEILVAKTDWYEDLSLEVGDGDRDGRHELYLAHTRVETFADGTGIPGMDEYQAAVGYQLQVWALPPDEADDFTSLFTASRDLPEPVRLSASPFGGEFPPTVRPLVAVGDWDGDNTVVRYTGEHWLATSHPRIVVAMAMPPVWAPPVAQDNDNNTWVGYGQISESSATEGNEISVNTSVTLSMEGGDPFGIVEASAGVTLSQELTKTETKTESVSTGVKQLATWSAEPDDAVVFVATEYHRYQYEVIAHDDDARIGELVTLDVPIQTNTFKKSVGAYNEVNGDERDIDAETFAHVIGDPRSYRSKADREALITEHGGWSAPAALTDPLYTVGETSGGGTEVFIEVSQETAEATARSLGVEVSAGFKVGGVGVETSVGVTHTAIYEISVTEATEYAGAVADIASSDYADKSYTFGLFVYNFTRDDGVKYQVLDWCVE